jgi:hypothetical protein
MSHNDKYIEPSIVPFIDSQFDVRYREQYPDFVSFVRAYYEWMEEEGGATNLSRGFLDLRDVDRTTQDFLVLMKEKYVNGLQLDTISDTRQLIKHAKDLYRAKGSARALDLFFRLLYNEVISLYYPKDDILIPSSGKWVKPKYLELSLSLDNIILEGKTITGLTSGATAFVDSIVRRVLGNRLSDTAYISAITGSFQTGEIIVPTDESLIVEFCPTIVGSLNTLTFDTSGSGSGYAVGDVIPVNSPYGVQGLARVSEIVDQSGLIDLTLINGGYGYTNTATMYVSDSVLNISNVNITNAYARKFFMPLGTVTQPMAEYNFRGGVGEFVAGDVVRAWSNSTTISGNGVVIEASYTNSTAGRVTLAIESGNLNSAQILTVSNSVYANLSVLDGGYDDITATGFVVGTANLVLSFANTEGTFTPGEQVVQHNVQFPTDQSVQGSGNLSVVGNTFMSLINREGVFRPGQVIGTQSGATANITAVQVTAGIKVTNNAFSALAGNIITASGLSGSVTFVGSDITATFGISPVLLYTEVVRVNSDNLASIATANLAGPYGLSGNVTANSSTLFSTYMTFANATIGSVSNVYTITSGTQFDAPPIAMLTESRTMHYNATDLTIKFSNATASFAVGEIITQSATSARALVKSTNSSSMTVTNFRLTPNNSFIPSTNSTTKIVGTSSGSEANVIKAWADRDNPQTGRNANLVANTVTSEGAVYAAQILDSGFGYVQGEIVWIGDDDQPGSNAAQGVVGLQTHGTGRGFYAQDGGFLSHNKKLFDGDYYQNFSYEITSSHQLDKYVDALKRVVHVAGMKVFGRYVHVGSGSNPVTSPGTTVSFIGAVDPGTGEEGMLDFSNANNSQYIGQLV